jgi:hypothetical protein
MIASPVGFVGISEEGEEDVDEAVVADVKEEVEASTFESEWVALCSRWSDFSSAAKRGVDRSSFITTRRFSESWSTNEGCGDVELTCIGLIEGVEEGIRMEDEL